MHGSSTLSALAVKPIFMLHRALIRLTSYRRHPKSSVGSAFLMPGFRNLHPNAPIWHTPPQTHEMSNKSTKVEVKISFSTTLCFLQNAVDRGLYKLFIGGPQSFEDKLSKAGATNVVPPRTT